MRSLLFLLVPLFISFTCNEDDKQGAYELAFKAKYADQPLVMTTGEYEYPRGYDLFISRFNFYISDVMLEGEEKNINLSEVTDVDFTDHNTSLEKAQEPLIVIAEDDIPPGEYTLTYNLGISEDLNAKTPSEYPSGHVLSSSRHYWPGWNSYIFLKLEGRADIDNDGTFAQGFTYHTGGNEALRKITFSRPVVITENGIYTDIITIDVEQVLEDGADYIDISQYSQAHTEVAADLINKIMNNMEAILEGN